MKKIDARFKSEALCHMDALMSYALRLTHDERDAEDLVQDSLLKAYRHFDKFEPGTNCKAWLFRVMTNLFISQYRHAQHELAMVDKSEELDENHADTRDARYPESLYSEKSEDFGDEVTRALGNVPDDFKSIVIMADLQDQSYREIADKLSIPIGTVMSRLFRGRQLLRSKLHNYAVSQGIVRSAG